MVKITLGVEGMACPMCEAHMNEAIRKAFNVKKVTSSHTKKSSEIIAEEAISEDALKEAVKETGYNVTSYTSEPYKKKFSLFGK